jgi:hypothetical protein
VKLQDGRGCLDVNGGTVAVSVAVEPRPLLTLPVGFEVVLVCDGCFTVVKHSVVVLVWVEAR